MIARRIVDNIYSISLGFVNVFLLNAGKLTLIDTGVPGSEKKILAAMRELGYQPQDLQYILITHLHNDHTGSLGELKRISGAKVYMHQDDADTFSKGGTMRHIEPSPGWIPRLIVNRLNASQSSRHKGNDYVDHTIDSHHDLEPTGGIQPIHTPGHTAGHTAYYWPQHGGVLLVGDAASNMFHLGYSILYENFAQGQKTLSDLSQLDFDIACFSHGQAILSGAKKKFIEKFAV